MAAAFRPPSGHVFRVERKRGAAWYAKYRLPDGRQVQKKLGPAWTERGRPPRGYFTKRIAEAWLRDTLDAARRGTLPGLVRTGATFADAAAEYLRYIEHDRGRKPSTLRGYQVFGASKGKQAVDLARDNKPAAAVLDVLLPDMMGFQLADQLRKISPEIPLVFITGYGPERIDQRFAGVPLLQKPVQLEALEEVLLSQLRRPGTAAPSRFWEGKSQRQQINP